MLKSCKRLKYVKFIVVIVKKTYASEVLFTKKNIKKTLITHIKVPLLIVLMQLTIQVRI